MTLSQFIKVAPRGMLLSVAVVFVLMNGLGVWQFQRMRWKENVIATMAQTQAQNAVPASDLLTQPRPDWRSAQLPACAFEARNLIYMHSEVAGVPGYRVLAACPIVQGQPEMLVDLGFTAQPLAGLDGFSFAPVGRLRPFEKPGMVTPVNRPADNDWYWRSARDMAPAFHTALRGDYFLVTDLSASRLSLPGLQQAPLNPQVSVPPERHLEYALTWFGLAWVLLGMFAALVWQRAKGK